MASSRGQATNFDPRCVVWNKAATEPHIRDNVIAQILQCIRKHKLEDTVELEEERVTKVSREDGVVQQSRLAISGKCGTNKKQQAAAMCSELKEMVVDLDVSRVEIALRQGEKAPDCDNLMNLDGEVERLFSMERKGKPTVLLFHSSQSGSCLDSLFQLRQVGACGGERSRLQSQKGRRIKHPFSREEREHQKQHPDIQVVTISIDYSFSDFRSISSHLFEGMHHLWTGAEMWNSTIVRSFGVTTIPCCLVVDKNRNIVWRGHPSLEANKMEQALRAVGVELKTSSKEVYVDSNNCKEDETNDDPSSTFSTLWASVPEDLQQDFYICVQDVLSQVDNLADVNLSCESSLLWRFGEPPLSEVSFVLCGECTTSCSEELGMITSQLQKLLLHSAPKSTHELPPLLSQSASPFFRNLVSGPD